VQAASWWSRDGEYRFGIVADRFVHGMVRSLVGTMVEVGRGRMGVADFVQLLGATARRGTGPTAPAHGLCLARVYYPGERIDF